MSFRDKLSVASPAPSGSPSFLPVNRHDDPTSSLVLGPSLSITTELGRTNRRCVDENYGFKLSIESSRQPVRLDPTIFRVHLCFILFVSFSLSVPLSSQISSSYQRSAL